MDEHRRAELPDDVRDGDVLVYMSGRLLVVDHLVPEAWTIDLVELHDAEGLADLDLGTTPEATGRRRGLRW